MKTQAAYAKQSPANLKTGIKHSAPKPVAWDLTETGFKFFYADGSDISVWDRGIKSDTVRWLTVWNALGVPQVGTGIRF